MVISGFSLIEIRKLYVGEMFEYYKSLVYLQEKRGELKEGAYDKINNSNNTVNSLRKQLFKIKHKTNG